MKRRKESLNRQYYLSNHRRQLLQDNPHCHYCETHLEPDTATIDHVIPRSKGGSDNPTNLVIACLACNVYKGHKDYYFRQPL